MLLVASLDRNVSETDHFSSAPRQCPSTAVLVARTSFLTFRTVVIFSPIDSWPLWSLRRMTP